MRVLGLAALLAVSANGALADDWAFGTQGEWSGTIACAAGDTTCLVLGCIIRAPLTWELQMPRDLVALTPRPALLVAEISVDGRVAGALPLTYYPDADLWTAPAEGDSTDRIVAALQAGHGARLEISAGSVIASADIRLNGSRAAIDATLAACSGPVAVALPQEPIVVVPEAGTGKPAAAATPATFPNAASGALSDNPAAAALARVQADCGGPEATEILPGFLRQSDLDGDGVNDVILDFAGAACVDAGPLYCGSAGCMTEIWLGQADGLYRQIFGGHAQQVTPLGAGLIDFGLHGGDCDLAGAAACAAVMRIDGGALVPAG